MCSYIFPYLIACVCFAICIWELNQVGHRTQRDATTYNSGVPCNGINIAAAIAKFHEPIGRPFKGTYRKIVNNVMANCDLYMIFVLFNMFLPIWGLYGRL